jgi:S1-C subfamily serine protease
MRPVRRRGGDVARAARAAAVAVVAGAAVLAGGCGGSGSGSGSGSGDGAPPPVLRVTVTTGDLVPEVATGVAVGDGRVLTVAHAIADRDRISVAGRPARVVRLDRGLDLAVLAVPGVRAPRVRLGGDARSVSIAVLRDRAPRRLGGTIRRRVLVIWRDQPGDPPRTRPGLELAARIDPGDSGAPVVDRRGRLLGVLYGRSSDAGGTAWAVDAAGVRALLGG